MGFLPEEPRHFNSLREEFIYNLGKALDADMAKRWPEWNRYMDSQFF